MSTPREQGFVMPPEWAPHERCWMAWPCREEHWGERIAAARQAHAEVAKAIAAFEPVTMIARPELTAEASVQCSGQGISVLPLEYDDSWIRDTAPTFVRNAEGLLAGVDWPFNGYGERSPEYAQDAALAEKICRRLKLPRFAAPIVLEGGAIHVDGEGTALVCAESVLDPRRNPSLDRAAAEAVLRDHLGVETVIWLARGLVDDASGGHVDNLACFAGPGVVLALAGGDADDPNRPILEDNLVRLRAARDAKGRELEVIEIEQPARASPRGRPKAHCFLHQLLSGEWRDHRADLRRSHGRRRLSRDPGGVPRPPGRRDRCLRSDLRRRRHPLHHAATAEDRHGVDPRRPGAADGCMCQKPGKAGVP